MKSIAEISRLDTEGKKTTVNLNVGKQKISKSKGQQVI